MAHKIRTNKWKEKKKKQTKTNQQKIPTKSETQSRIELIWRRLQQREQLSFLPLVTLPLPLLLSLVDLKIHSGCRTAFTDWVLQRILAGSPRLRGEATYLRTYSQWISITINWTPRFKRSPYTVEMHTHQRMPTALPTEFTRFFSKISGDLFVIPLGLKEHLTAAICSAHCSCPGPRSLIPAAHLLAHSPAWIQWFKHGPWVLIPRITMRMSHLKDPCPCIPQGSELPLQTHKPEVSVGAQQVKSLL